jgi:hypothetical protein
MRRWLRHLLSLANTAIALGHDVTTTYWDYYLLGLTCMRLRILQTAIVCLCAAGIGVAQQPQKLRMERDGFFSEALSSNPSPRTLYYDTALEGSY